MSKCSAAPSFKSILLHLLSRLTSDLRGRFSELYPKTGGGEDADFCLKSGARLISVPSATCHHPLWSSSMQVPNHHLSTDDHSCHYKSPPNICGSLSEMELHWDCKAGGTLHCLHACIMSRQLMSGLGHILWPATSGA